MYNWTWANLTGSQLQQVAEAEDTLGPDYLVAYEVESASAGSPLGSLLGSLQIASLTPSQLECLQGLENQLRAVVVAYDKGK